MQDELLYWIFYDVVQYYNGKLNENKNNTKKKTKTVVSLLVDCRYSLFPQSRRLPLIAK